MFASGGGGSNYNKTLRQVTIASQGNTVEFGERTVLSRLVTAAASQTRATFAGGINVSSTNFNTIDYIQIQSLGNATDFGDMTAAFHAHTGVSDSHGGLGGF